MSQQHAQTEALHAGHDVSKTQGTRAVPIYQSTAYVFNDTDHAAKLFGLQEFGYIYTRLNNPTNDILEQRVAAIDGGIGAVSFASGTAATSTALLTLLRSGDHIVASNSLYGGTYNLLDVTLPRLGITTTFVDPSDPQNFEKAIQDNTKLFFVETVGNPKLDVLDLEAIADVAKAHKKLVVADNTVATPFLFKPLAHGADITIYSLTKYFGGNGSTLGGAVVDGGTFDWSNGTFPEFIEPAKGYHGLKYAETFGPLAFLVKLRVEGLRDLGAAISPQSSYNILQGIESLGLRMNQHSNNAQALANWLVQQEEVAWVNYPGLESSKYYDLGQKYLPNGQSGLLTFGLKGGYDAAKQVTDAVELFSLVANFGDSRSLIIHPASTTHQQLTPEKQESTGVTNDLIRLSVGLENIDDLTADLRQALDQLD